MYNFLTNDTYPRSTVTHEFVWRNQIFSDEELTNIENTFGMDPLEDSVTVGARDKEQIEQVRKSKIKFFKKDESNEWIFERLNYNISELNDMYYNFILNGYNMMQYTVYDSSYKGKYDWHMDTTLGYSINDMSFDHTDRETRKLTAIVLLNEPNVDFCGGDFQIYTGGNIENSLSVNMRKGTLVCFPSFLIHRVKPVLLGVRKSLVIWVTGPKFR
jgi:PKHD-type hydroxylase